MYDTHSELTMSMKKLVHTEGGESRGDSEEELDSFAGLSKVELVLKQKYIAADQDNSGSVNNAELFDVIRNSMDGDLDFFTRMMHALAGAPEGLMGQGPEPEQPQGGGTGSQQGLHETDLDGDGDIS